MSFLYSAVGTFWQNITQQRMFGSSIFLNKINKAVNYIFTVSLMKELSEMKEGGREGEGEADRQREGEEQTDSREEREFLPQTQVA